MAFVSGMADRGFWFLSPNHHSVSIDIGRQDKCETTDSMPILLFSGGRDSTLAAVRLARQCAPLTLLTMTHDGLENLFAVKVRLRELSPLLRAGTEWLLVERDPDEVRLQEPQPIHLKFNITLIVTATEIAKERDVCEIAFGYADYQAHWTEQSPPALSELSSLLRRSGFELLLPVWSLVSKEAAIEELTTLNLSVAALEQKSSSRNAALSCDELRREIRLWAACIEAAVQQPRFSSPTLLEHLRLDGEMQWVPVNL